MDWVRVELIYWNEKIIGRDILLSYPNFSEKFIINTDYRKTYLGGVIRKNGKPTQFIVFIISFILLNPLLLC